VLTNTSCFPSGRHSRLIVVGGIGGETFETGAVGLHAKEIGRALTVRCKDDALAVGRKHRIVVEVGRAQERTFLAAVGGGDEHAESAGIGRHPCIDDLFRRSIGGNHSHSGGHDQEANDSHGRIVASHSSQFSVVQTENGPSG
jgi:hypothetical protein